MANMTERQQRIVSYLRRRAAADEVPPTLDEIATAVGLSSKSAVQYQLKQLAQQRIVERGDERARRYHLMP